MVHFFDMWETFNPAFKTIKQQVDIGGYCNVFVKAAAE